MKRLLVVLLLAVTSLCAPTSGEPSAAKQTPEVAREIDQGRTDWTANGTREAIDVQLPAFFGEAEGDFISTIAYDGTEGDPGIGTNSPKLLEQFRFIFWQGPGPAIYFKDGFRMLVAFQAGNAGTQVMAITSGNSNQLVATAFSNMACPTQKFDPAATACKADVVTVVYPADVAPNPSLTREIVAWVNRPSDDPMVRQTQQQRKHRVTERVLQRG